MSRQNKKTETISLTVTSEFADRLRTLSKLFRFADLGEAIEEFTGWKLENMLDGSTGELLEEMMHYEFDSVEEVESFMAEAAKLNPRLPELKHRIVVNERSKIEVDFNNVYGDSALAA